VHRGSLCGTRKVSRLDALRLVDDWPAETVAVAVLDSSGAELAARGPRDRVFRWASITKLLTTYAVLIGAEEGTVDLDEPAGPPGSTVRHLLAHASGLPFTGDAPIARPGQRRIYSNPGLEAAAAHLAERAGMPFEEYLRAAVLEPLGMRAELRGSPAADMAGSLDDLLAFVREVLEPRLIARETLDEALSVQFPGLPGVVPDLGRFDPNDWGLGFELRDAKSPHWTGTRNSERTYGHFGGSGTFVWVDPEAGLACACLTDLEFDEWAKAAWPPFSDAVLAEFAG
jgi:CubicO group peptidase (beta-lactamase class C family)